MVFFLIDGYAYRSLKPDINLVMSAKPSKKAYEMTYSIGGICEQFGLLDSTIFMEYQQSDERTGWVGFNFIFLYHYFLNFKIYNFLNITIFI